MKTTVKLDTSTKLLGVFLHYPDTQREQPLPGVQHSCKLDLSSGNYAIVASGTGLDPGAEVKFTISTEADSKEHAEEVSQNGSIIYRFSFVLMDDGTILGGDW